MERIKTKIRRRKHSIKYKMGPEKWIIVAAIIMCLVFTYGAISAMTRNWGLEQEIAEKQRELTLIQLEVDTLKLENQYYASEEYQELSARAKLNKVGDGETLVYLPKNSEEAKKKHETESVAQSYETPSNFNQWLTFLFGI